MGNARLGICRGISPGLNIPWDFGRGLTVAGKASFVSSWSREGRGVGLDRAPPNTSKGRSQRAMEKSDTFRKMITNLWITQRGSETSWNGQVGRVSETAGMADTWKRG